jgi:hypothetical protein
LTSGHEGAGVNVRPILINVNEPETRGLVIALQVRACHLMDLFVFHGGHIAALRHERALAAQASFQKGPERNCSVLFLHRAEKQRKGKSPNSRVGKSKSSQYHWNGTAAPSRKSVPALLARLRQYWHKRTTEELPCAWFACFLLRAHVTMPVKVWLNCPAN